ncbi:GIY-YIG nuclease family protein [Pseudomaricurvus sp. HS19]|uniref:GIY-YIG nuclease family protein n=1 Tax=Pseudomaricurvus sp. HS19 TaxID=2692626 RepID=UPI00136E7BC1|nr:GIY-YIG nuclease family protein [Pseudomaricurvus sp. HS19]MYM62072.1 GIY-YIG nuclease family protein [Pseudomaricurvus sp. HS19]
MKPAPTDTVLPPSVSAADGSWCVYIILSSDERLYTGITNNLPKRWQAHSNGSGARFFRGRRPQTLLYRELQESRSSASKREYEIKQLKRDAKLALIATQQHLDWHSLLGLDKE